MTGSVLLGIFIATNAGYFYLDPESSRFAPWLALYTLQFGLLALSPVVDAWYVLWILPLAIVERSLPWLAFTYLVGLSYVWSHSPALSPYLGTVEYLTLFALLWRHRGSIVDR